MTLQHPLGRPDQLVPFPEPEFVAGRPNIYGINYLAVNGWYIGKNQTGIAAYMGSPSDAALKAIADAHAAVHIRPEDIVRYKHILWSPPEATIADCRDQEWIWIARFRAYHDGPVFNVFPVEDRSNDFHWSYHDPLTHVDQAQHSRWPVVYLKFDTKPDANGNCSGGKNGCGRPWGNHASSLYWCKAVHHNGREEWLYEPGPFRTLPFRRYREHKLRMINRGETA